ncbi:stage III sporulation protein AB [Cellulosilyticum sp. I15G10I2]|uniref:stage III sporulation protein AB n=1 Tax=Cellulosilyticum sp. I15G10I2 TaxID=1892843 RepID=UPI00085C3F81|nr:stage III sporulation protein AB [Cellulosilyticum sp. I15G10I2]
MKLLGIILMFVSCSTCGFIIDWHENKRLKELEKFIYAFEILKAEIDYRLTPLQEAAIYVSKLSSEGIKKVFETFAGALGDRNTTDLNVMWEQALNHHKTSFHLSQQDYSLLFEFSNACGYLDKNMQKKNIDMLIYKLEQELIMSKSKYQKNTKLNKYLGVLIGACISIFLI